MEDNQQQFSGGAISKEEMARRISGSISARHSEEEQLREQAIRRGARETRRAQPARRVDNPYMPRIPEEPSERQRYAYPDERMTDRRGQRPYPQRDPERQGQAPGQRRASSPGEPLPRQVRRQGAPRMSKAERAKRRKEKRRKQILAAAVTLVILSGLAAGGGMYWFSHGKAEYDGIFLDHTYINGADVSRMTVDEAAETVKNFSDMPDVITITKPDGVDVKFPLTDLDSKDNIKKNVTDFFNEQNHNEWFRSKSQDTNYSFKVEFDFDKQLLFKEVDRKIIQGQKAVKSKNARIERTGTGFEIVPEVVGTVIDKDKVQTLYDFIDGFLARESYSIDLKNCNCYKLPKVTTADLREEIGALNSLYDVEFTFDFGYTKEVLEGSTVIDWITFENDDPLEGYSVDQKSVEDYVKWLADKYDTFGKPRQFNSTTRGEMTIEQGEGCYGWWIDKEKTENLLIDLIRDGISAEFEPYYYTSEGNYSYTCRPEWRTEYTDFSDTYCEVDLKEQHFWYYENGEKKYECDIVSGKPTAARNTPGGVYKVWYKELNKTLVGSTSEGESWSTFVNYWNNISTFGIGLHDATWHPWFGGNRYVDYGSHGCINMPIDAAKYVYEHIDLDTPVFMYW